MALIVPHGQPRMLVDRSLPAAIVLATGGNRAGHAGAIGCVYADTIGQRERPTRPPLPRLLSGKVGGICC